MYIGYVRAYVWVYSRSGILSGMPSNGGTSSFFVIVVRYSFLVVHPNVRMPFTPWNVRESVSCLFLTLGTCYRRLALLISLVTTQYSVLVREKLVIRISETWLSVLQKFDLHIARYWPSWACDLPPPVITTNIQYWRRPWRQRGASLRSHSIPTGLLTGLLTVYKG